MSTTLGTFASRYFGSIYYNHMTSKPYLFHFKSIAKKASTTYTDDNSHMHISHIGYISTSYLSFPDTFFVSKLTLNFVSVRQLCYLRFLHFSYSSCHI